MAKTRDQPNVSLSLLLPLLGRLCYKKVSSGCSLFLLMILDDIAGCSQQRLVAPLGAMEHGRALKVETVSQHVEANDVIASPPE